ncbi:iron-containing alcohol dehydrogenase [Myroides sp. LJL119]
MENFELFNPTKLFFGKGEIHKLKNEIPIDAKVLLVYGQGSIHTNGVYQQVSTALKNHIVIEFGGIQPNPVYETLQKALAIIHQEKIDFILGVGGGSVIDGVKYLSAATHYKGNPIEIIQNKMNVKWETLPYGAVLTLPATGSEMNCGAVITIESTHEKLSFQGNALYPKFSICDPTVIGSLPSRQISNGLVDGFIHVLEQYLTYPQDAFLQDRFAEAILSTFVEVAPKVLKDPTNYSAASTFMWCCTMALNGLISMGVKQDWVTHALGHELTVLYGIDHGRSLAIVNTNLYRVMFDFKQQKLAQLGKQVFKIDNGTTQEIAMLTLEKLDSFYHSVGVSTHLSDYTDDYLNTSDFIVERFKERGWVAMGERKNITLDKIAQIIQKSY